jgi:hypothetical protein
LDGLGRLLSLSLRNICLVCGHHVTREIGNRNNGRQAKHENSGVVEKARSTQTGFLSFSNYPSHLVRVVWVEWFDVRVMSVEPS